MNYTQEDLDKVLNKFINSDIAKMPAGYLNRSLTTDYKSFQEKRVNNTDYKSRTKNINYKQVQKKRLANTDFKAIAAKRDYKAIAAKKHKSILQFDLQGNFIKEWDSAKEAAIAIGKPGNDNIGACCRGKLQQAYGFIWKFKSEQN